MFAMITTEEYKELVLAKETTEKLADELRYADAKLREAQSNLKEILLMLTGGHTVPKYGDVFESFDIIDDAEIAKYISAYYMDKGILKFTKNKGEE